MRPEVQQQTQLLAMAGEDAAAGGIVGFITSLVWMGCFMALIVLTLLYFFQEKMLYIPDIGTGKDPDTNPRGYRNPGVSSVIVSLSWRLRHCVGCPVEQCVPLNSVSVRATFFHVTPIILSRCV
jgi:hypothetical protein